jgi:hypothetical protein
MKDEKPQMNCRDFMGQTGVCIGALGTLSGKSLSAVGMGQHITDDPRTNEENAYGPVVKVQIAEKLPSGAKAHVDSVGFMRGLKPPPPSGMSFSAACEGWTYDSEEFSRRLCETALGAL